MYNALTLAVQVVLDAVFYENSDARVLVNDIGSLFCIQLSCYVFS